MVNLTIHHFTTPQRISKKEDVTCVPGCRNFSNRGVHRHPIDLFQTPLFPLNPLSVAQPGILRPALAPSIPSQTAPADGFHASPISDSVLASKSAFSCSANIRLTVAAEQESARSMGNVGGTPAGTFLFGSTSRGIIRILPDSCIFSGCIAAHH